MVNTRLSNPRNVVPWQPAQCGGKTPEVFGRAFAQRFSQAVAVLTEVTDDAPFAVTSGARPQQNVSYKDTTGRFFSGTWASEAFESEQRPFPYNEFAYVQDGSITLTDAEGAAEEFDAGDAFFIPEGVECSATVAGSVRLFITVIKSD